MRIKVFLGENVGEEVDDGFEFEVPSLPTNGDIFEIKREHPAMFRRAEVIGCKWTLKTTQDSAEKDRPTFRKATSEGSVESISVFCRPL